MDASRVQRHQEIMASQSLDSMLVCTKPQNQQQQQQQQQEEKKPRPTEEALKCPRCDSSNTKFCYYNNYSLTQPRYFCKSCRRYWTKGGTLRNVPVGGGCRKNKRCSRRSTPDHLHSSFITSPTSSTSQHLVSPFGSFEHCYTSGMASLGNNFDLFGNNNHQYYGGYLGGAEHFDLHQLQQHQENNSSGVITNTHNNVASSSSGSLLTPTIKQELGGDNNSHNRAFLNYIMGGGGGGGGGGGEIDAHRESWNAGVLGSSSWHNLINSPLM